MTKSASECRYSYTQARNSATWMNGLLPELSYPTLSRLCAVNPQGMLSTVKRALVAVLIRPRYPRWKQELLSQLYRTHT